MINKPFGISGLVTGGNIVIPDKIKVTYRYKKVYDPAFTSKIYVFGLEPDKTTPTLMCTARVLLDSTCPRERTMTTMIELVASQKVTDMFVTLSNYESMQDVFEVVAVYDFADIKQGIQATNAAFDCDGLGIPVATAATSIAATSFTANWEEAIGATGYKLDVSTDLEFTTFVSGYENLDVGLVLTLPITGLAEDTCHFYRVRAVNSDGFISQYSNEIHVAKDTSNLVPAVDPVTLNRYYYLSRNNPGYLKLGIKEALCPTVSNSNFTFSCSYNRQSVVGVWGIPLLGSSTGSIISFTNNSTGRYVKVVVPKIAGSSYTNVDYLLPTNDSLWHTLKVYYKWHEIQSLCELKLWCDGILITPANQYSASSNLTETVWYIGTIGNRDSCYIKNIYLTWTSTFGTRGLYHFCNEDEPTVYTASYPSLTIDRSGYGLHGTPSGFTNIAGVQSFFGEEIV